MNKLEQLRGDLEETSWLLMKIKGNISIGLHILSTIYKTLLRAFNFDLAINESLVILSSSKWVISLIRLSFV